MVAFWQMPTGAWNARQCCTSGCGNISAESDSPVQATSSPTFQTITTSSGGATFDPQHGASCALTAAGAAWCWGQDGSGPIGNGTTPTAVSTGQTVTSISLSGPTDHGCAVVTGGNAYCWGSNYYGQLGNGTSLYGYCVTPITAPVQVSGGIAFTQISAGYGYTCALTAAGAAYCWGGGPGGGASPRLMTVPAGVTFTQISVGAFYACAVAAGGTA